MRTDLVGRVNVINVPLGHAPFFSTNRGHRQSNRGRRHAGQRLGDCAGCWLGLRVGATLIASQYKKRRKEEKKVLIVNAASWQTPAIIEKKKKTNMQKKKDEN